MENTTLRLPPRFYADHVSRDLPAGTVVRRTKTGVYVELTEDEVAEIRSDADYYATAGDAFDTDLRGLVASAKATVRAIDKQHMEAR